ADFRRPAERAGRGRGGWFWGRLLRRPLAPGVIPHHCRPRPSASWSTSAIVTGGAPRQTMSMTAGGTKHAPSSNRPVLVVTATPSTTVVMAAATATIANQTPIAVPRLIVFNITGPLFVGLW